MRIAQSFFKKGLIENGRLLRESGEQKTRTERAYLGTKPKIKMAKAKSVVGLVRDYSAGEALERLGKLAPLFDFVKKGQTVLVKPNVNTADPFPGTSKPDMVEAIVRVLYKKGAGKVVVGDMSTVMMARKSRENMMKTGIAKAALGAGAEIVAFNELEWMKVRPKGAGRWLRGFCIPKILDEVDHTVNLSLVKTHYIANFTMSLKNVVGITSETDRLWLHLGRNIGEKIAELNLAWKPSINILDARRVFVSGGPATGEEKVTGLVIASKDRIAIDVVGLAILKALGTTEKIQDKSVWEQPQIKRAVELGLGASGPEQVEIKSWNVPDIERIRQNIL